MALLFLARRLSVFVMGYALLKDADPSKRFRQGTVGSAITLSVALTAAIVLAAAFSS